MVDFNGSACVGIVLQLLLEHARLVVRNKGMWPASHTAVYDVRLCMVPGAARCLDPSFSSFAAFYFWIYEFSGDSRLSDKITHPIFPKQRDHITLAWRLGLVLWYRREEAFRKMIAFC